MVYILSSAVM